MKHSKGPWTLIPQYENNGFALLVGPKANAHDLIRIGERGGDVHTRAIDAANASLIAAAPDLLYACQQVAEAIQSHMSDAEWTFESAADNRDILLAAITRAIGGKP